MHRGFRLLQFVFLLIAGMYSQHGWAESWRQRRADDD